MRRTGVAHLFRDAHHDSVADEIFAVAPANRRDVAAIVVSHGVERDVVHLQLLVRNGKLRKAPLSDAVKNALRCADRRSASAEKSWR